MQMNFKALTMTFLILAAFELIASKGSANSELISNRSNPPQCSVQFKLNNVCVDLDWKKPPVAGEESALDVYFTSQASGTTIPVDPISGSQSLKIFIWMPGMGHGGPPIIVNRISEGVYALTKVRFIMGGQWDLKFQIKDGANIIDEVKFQVEL